MSTNKRVWTIGAIAAVVFLAPAAIAIGSRVGSNGHSAVAAAAGWAPGFAQLSKARALPVVAAPAAMKEMIGVSATATGSSSAGAFSSLRLLRGNLGATRAALYAYAPADGPVCVMLWRRQGICPTAASSRTPGVAVILSPGGPGYVGQPDDVPPVIAGVAADNVKAVSITRGGVTTRLPIVNNAFFSTIDEAPGSAFSVELGITYVDGSKSSQTLQQLGAFRANADGTRP